MKMGVCKAGMCGIFLFAGVLAAIVMLVGFVYYIASGDWRIYGKAYRRKFRKQTKCSWFRNHNMRKYRDSSPQTDDNLIVRCDRYGILQAWARCPCTGLHSPAMIVAEWSEDA